MIGFDRLPVTLHFYRLSVPKTNQLPGEEPG